MSTTQKDQAKHDQAKHKEAMDKQQEAVEAMQAQALESVKKGQAATLDAIRQWHEGMAKFAPSMPATPALPDEVKASIGKPEEIVDSVYDFASQLLELNKKFAHQLLEASAPKSS